MTKINFTLNNKQVHIECDATKRLLDILREEFKVLDVKEGCGEGECGACAVLLDHQIVNSCITPVGNVMNKSVMTADGLLETKRGQAIKQAFADHGSVQCGICTPGMVMATESLLHRIKNPTEAEIREGLSGNLCRCTGYNMIVKAVQYLASEVDLW